MNIKKLHKRLTDPIESFAKLGDTEYTEHGPLTYIDRGSNVLAVAHLDWVHFNKNPVFTKQYQNYKVSQCPQLDDRLGAWMVLDVLPRAGIKCDVLLTDSEEVGESTAQYFKPPKQYNWVMQFDRAGSDVVMYDYETDELRNLLRGYDYTVSYGSFTDICYLEEHNFKGFNFGVGYHAQHTQHCYANLSETWDSFRKVQAFYHDNKDIHYSHEKVEYQPPVFGYHNASYTWTGNTYKKSPVIRRAKSNKKKNKGRNTLNELSNNQFKPEEKDRTELLQEFDSEQEMHYELDVVANDMFGQDYYWLEPYQQELVDESVLDYWE